jgi:hypothetical protein
MIDSTRGHFSTLIITLFSTFALVPILVVIIVVIIRRRKESRKKQSTKNQRNGFDNGLEKYDEIINESEHEYEQINYFEMNIKANEIIEYTQILE